MTDKLVYSGKSMESKVLAKDAALQEKLAQA